MIANNRSINLPRNNKEELEIVKKVLQTIPKFNNCLELHAKLKNYNLSN